MMLCQWLFHYPNLNTNIIINTNIKLMHNIKKCTIPTPVHQAYASFANFAWYLNVHIANFQPLKINIAISAAHSICSIGMGWNYSPNTTFLFNSLLLDTFSFPNYIIPNIKHFYTYMNEYKKGNLDYYYKSRYLVRLTLGILMTFT